jgi:hypothetical protein
MVEPGYFPVSSTGYRSVTTFIGSVWRGEMRAEKVPEVIEENGVESYVPGRGDLSFEAEENRSELKGSGFSKASALIGGGPRSEASLLLSSSRQDWDKIIEPRIRQITAGLEIMKDENKETFGIPEGRIQATKKQGQEALKILRGAHASSLFAGERDLDPALEAAPVVMKEAYGAWSLSRETKAEMRRLVRKKAESDVIRQELLKRLAGRYIEAEIQP